MAKKFKGNEGISLIAGIILMLVVAAATFAVTALLINIF